MEIDIWYDEGGGDGSDEGSRDWLVAKHHEGSYDEVEVRNKKVPMVTIKLLFSS